MTKLWLNAASDDFFYPDHTENFWEDLPSPKDLFAPVAAFTNAILLEQPLPQITWKIDNTSGEILVQQSGGPAPSSVTVWSSTTCAHMTRRDFRKVTLDPLPECLKCGIPLGPFCDISRATQWVEKERLDAGKTRWSARVPDPPAGWAAFYVAFEFPSPVAHGDPLQLSTEVSVVPFGRYPYSLPDCGDKGCPGNHKLVLLSENSTRK